MATNQIFVKLLDGRTQCLQISTPTISGEALKLHLLSKTRIPLRLQRLVSGSREISDETLISASVIDGLFPSCALLLRLRGGKGGFGSLLRGAATKAGQKKTNNFDACRDMSGRRLRHVNAEKRLEEWRAEAEDRRLEKLAEEFLKKKAKEVKKNKTGDVEKYVEKYREDSARCMEEIDESVRQSFGLYKESKRKGLPSLKPDAKRLKIWLGKKKLDESDSNDDDEEEEEDADGDEEDQKSVVIENGSCKVETTVREEDGGLVSGQSDEESSGGGSEKSILEENNDRSLEASEASGSGDSNSADSVGSVEAKKMMNEEIVDKVVVSRPEVMPKADSAGLVVEQRIECKVEMAVENADASGMEKPLSINKFNSAAELEVLGMERLKTELQSQGLKCGGTLQERAARLFLLKTTPIDKLPKKLLAKPTTSGK